MPFIKNISLTRKKSPAAPPPMSFSITATATGSAGYFTGSNGKIYSGATSLIPIYITFTTSSVLNGTPPYICKWTSSTSYWPPGYVSGTDTGSITLETYAYESERWTATVTDSSNPPNVVSSSFDSIIYSTDFEICVGTWDATGSDTQDLDLNDVPGGTTKPLKTIDAAIRYAVPDNTIILVASGTYNENPVLDKRVYLIDGTADVNGNPSLGSNNYFIYATKDLTGSFSNVSGSVIRGFISSSFQTIGVNPSGSIQMAINDIPISGTIYLLPGNHQITTGVTCSRTYTIRGEQVNTGSSITDFPTPTSVIQFSPISSSLFVLSGSSNVKIENLVIEIPTGSFAANGQSNSHAMNIQVGATGNIETEMVQYRLVNSGITYDLTGFSGQGNVRGFTGSANRLEFANNFGPISNWHIGNHIIDGRDGTATSPNGGSGIVIHGKYSPIKQGADRKVQFVDLGNVQASISSGSTSQLIYNIANTANITAPSIGNRPFYGVGDSFFNGCAYQRFDGTARVVAGVQSVLNSDRSTLIGFFVFQPNSLAQNNGVISKHGNDVQGYSLVMSASNVITTLYATASSGVTCSLFMDATVPGINSPYIVEFFFNSSSLDKRIGIAFYGTSSLLTSSYFSDQQFTASLFSQAAGVTPNTNISIGGRSGFFRSKDLRVTASGLSNYFNGRIPFIFTDNGEGLHNDDFRRSIFYLLKKRYFPSGSSVTHSLFA